MKKLSKVLIPLLQFLQKFPYEEVISSLENEEKLQIQPSNPDYGPTTLFLSVTEEGVFINDIEIIKKNTTIAYKIFFALYNQCLEDLKNRKSHEDFKLLSVEKIAKILSPNDESMIISPDDQIRRPLNKLRKQIQKKLKKILGIEIDINAVIEFVPWRNLNTPHGYKIGSFIVIVLNPIPREECIPKFG